jgi:hypothetical protein
MSGLRKYLTYLPSAGESESLEAGPSNGWSPFFSQKSAVTLICFVLKIATFQLFLGLADCHEDDDNENDCYIDESNYDERALSPIHLSGVLPQIFIQAFFQVVDIFMVHG